MFSDRDKLIALAIVHIFETAKPFGDYSAVAVLNDGAGISYGINQFTHKSGWLLKVLKQFFANSGPDPGGVLHTLMQFIEQNPPDAINRAASNPYFKDALRGAGKTPAMQAAQRQVATEGFLQPAIAACEGSHFEKPLSLAVIYDSINHGSYEKIRDEDTVTHEQVAAQVTVDRTDHGNAESFERAWISEYVRLRDEWLASVPRLAVTRYRTRLFLNLIRANNWQMDLPIVVQGVRLTDATFANSATVPVVQPTNSDASVADQNTTLVPSVSAEIAPPPTNLTTVQVQKQKPSIKTMLVAIGTAIYGAIMFAQTYFGSIYNKAVDAIDGKIIAWGLLEVAIIALGIWLWNYSHRDADASTAQLIEKAADPTSNTVELTKGN